MSRKEPWKTWPKDTRRGRCYLGVCSRSEKQRIKRQLVLTPGVYRITDHGAHLKINTSKTLPPVRGLRVSQVVDETTHWDVRYWDFAVAAFKHASARGHDQYALRVMIHYLCNLFGVNDEAMFFARLAVKRARLDAKLTAKAAHGWELRHTAKLRRKR